MSKSNIEPNWDTLFAETSRDRVTIEFESGEDKTVFLQWLESAGENGAIGDLTFEAMESGRMRKGHAWTEDEQYGLGYTFVYGNPNRRQELSDVERVKVLSFDDGDEEQETPVWEQD